MTNQVDVTDVHGIKYYSTAYTCISQFETKSWVEKSISIIFSFGNLFIYAMNRVFMKIGNVEKQMKSYTKAPTNSSSNRLIVCLHGLNNNPTQFKKIVDEMEQKKHSDFNIYIPKILKRGNAKLDEMISPILKDISEWAKIGEDKELILVGISNGGRIARAIEAELINSDQIGKITRLRFVSIVGACKGSSLVTLAKKLHLSWILSKNIAEEMSPDSARFKQLEIDYENARKMTELTRDYTFIAAPYAHDWQVPDYSSSLMDMTDPMDTTDADVKYAIVPNHGHNSIVNAVAKSIATIVMEY